mgnify:CR=1 FL=1
MPDITAPLVDFCVRVVGDYGLIAVFVLMTLESALIPVPSEAIMLFGGFLVSQGHHSLLAMVAAGVAGNVLGSWLAFWLGHRGGRDWLLKIRWLHINEGHLDSAQRWFDRWGTWAILVSRCLPIVRTFISLPAGMARVPFWRFTVLTVVGCIPWVLMLTLAGRAVGDHWRQLQHNLHYFDYVLVAGVIAGIVWMVRRRRRPRTATPR